MHELPINKIKLRRLIKEAKYFNIFPIYLPNHYYGEDDHPISPLLIDLVNEAEELLQATSESEIVKGDVGSKTTCGSTNLFKMVQYKMFLFA